MTRTESAERFARQQIGRLLGKKFAPTERVLMDEVVRAVIESAVDDTHVISIIDHLLTQPGDFPEPAVFRQTASLTKSVDMVPAAGCTKCGGCGWITTAIGGQIRRFKCQCGASPGCSVCHGEGEFEALVGAATGSTRCSCWHSAPRTTTWTGEG